MMTTILVAAYNSEAFLERAITSALAQQLPRDTYEILVVDDGSTDGSLAILERYQADVRILRLTHRGLPGTCNEGIKAARGDYLMRLDADDELEPTILAHTAAVLGQREDVAFVTTDRWEIDEATGRTMHIHVDPANLYDLIAPGVLFRKAALVEVGGYEDLYWEEYDLFIRLLRRFRAQHVVLPLYRYHRHPTSMTASVEDRRKAWESLIQKWGIEELRRVGRCPELEEVWGAR